MLTQGKSFGGVLEVQDILCPSLFYYCKNISFHVKSCWHLEQNLKHKLKSINVVFFVLYLFQPWASFSGLFFFVYVFPY